MRTERGEIARKHLLQPIGLHRQFSHEVGEDRLRVADRAPVAAIDDEEERGEAVVELMGKFNGSWPLWFRTW